MTQTRSKSARPLDYEMLILVPILTLLLILNVGALINRWSTLSGEPLELAQTVLTICFYVLLVVLLLIRRPAKELTRSPIAVIAAYVGSFLPFAMILNSHDGASGRFLSIGSIILMLVGLTFSLYSLAWLGRSFGVVPAARKLVRSGPYAVVRHPLYVGELVTFIGVVMGQLTALSTAVLIALVTIQCYRALQEEKVLRLVFTEYEEYSAKTARFIPGIV